MSERPTPSLPSGEVGDFEHINRIEAMRNRLAAGETTFTLDELKLTLAWADHLNYFLSGEKRENATLLAALTASEAERERMRDALRPFCKKAFQPAEWMSDEQILYGVHFKAKHLRRAADALDSTP